MGLGDGCHGRDGRPLHRAGGATWFGAYSAVIRGYRGEDIEAEADQLYADSRHFDDPQYLTIGAFAIAVICCCVAISTRSAGCRRRPSTRGLAGAESRIFGARASIWKGDAASATGLRDFFASEGDGGRTRALLATMDAGIAVLEGRRADARGHYLEAIASSASSEPRSGRQ